MLISLTARNFALIESINLQFEPGLNIITGETGAGKSIIVDALMAVLGERTSTDLVRSGEEKAIIEGVFNIVGNISVDRLLNDRGYGSNSSELIIRREINAKGSSRSFVNDSPAPALYVREIGSSLIDFHGQHDHQSLLIADKHIALLDESGAHDVLLREYGEEFAKMQALRGELSSLKKREDSLRRERDFKEFQLDELERLSPVAGEPAQLEAELAVIQNAEKIFGITNEIYLNLYGDDNSARDKLTKALFGLEQLNEFDDSFGEYIAECKQALISAVEISKYAKDYQNRLDFSVGRIDYIRDRLQQYSRLQKKYGANLSQLLVLLRADLDLTENFETEIERLIEEISVRRRSLGATGARLSAARRETANYLEGNIEDALRGLGIPNAKFQVICEQSILESNDESATSVEIEGKFLTAFPDGLDRVEFYISTNKGEAPKPLARVASGGEISRVMLALKGILAKNDHLPILVFDEIDTGISGRVARKVGFAMRDLAAFHQIIAITHLPQIAALADFHIAVEKSERHGRAIVTASELGSEERVIEVAKLIGGEAITEAAIGGARELILANDRVER